MTHYMKNLHEKLKKEGVDWYDEFAVNQVQEVIDGLGSSLTLWDLEEGGSFFVMVTYYSDKLQKNIMLDSDLSTNLPLDMLAKNLIQHEEEATRVENIIDHPLDVDDEELKHIVKGNKNMVKALKRLGQTPEQISDICNGAI